MVVFISLMTSYTSFSNISMRVIASPFPFLESVTDSPTFLGNKSIYYTQHRCNPFKFCQFRRRLSLSRCYQVIPSNFQAFSNQWLASESVTAFDASSCYWLAADFLVETVSFLVNLEELYIHDTTVTLLHLARIFKFCQKITKLSHGVIEASWQEVKHELAIDSSSSCDALILSFHRVTHLKLVVFNAAYYIDSWLIVLRILR